MSTLSGAGALLLSIAMLPVGCGDGADAGRSVIAVVGRAGSAPGRFVSPRSVAVDPRGDAICVVDRSGRIQRFTRTAAATAGAGAAPDGGAEGAGGWRPVQSWRLPRFEKGQPTGLAFDRDGRLLVADTHYQRILVYDVESGALLREFGREGAGDGEFTQVRDVIQDDASGAIFAGDFCGPQDRIQRFDAQGRFELSFGRRGDGPGEFRRPQGLALQDVAAAGGGRRRTLLVADSCNHRIQRFDLDGRFLDAWGQVGEAPGDLKYPYGIAVDGDDVLVVEWGNNRVQRFDSRGRSMGVWGGPGRDVARLATPWDVTRGPDGSIFVADYGNDRVQVFRWPGEPRAARSPGVAAVGAVEEAHR